MEDPQTQIAILEHKTAKLQTQIKELKAAALEVLDESKEIKEDMEALVKHAQGLYDEIAPLLPKNGKLNPMVLVQLLPKLQDSAFLDKMSGYFDPILELLNKYK